MNEPQNVRIEAEKWLSLYLYKAYNLNFFCCVVEKRMYGEKLNLSTFVLIMSI